MIRIGLALINLDRDTARLAHMAGQLDAQSLAFERFLAVYGLAVPDWLKPWFFDAEGRVTPTLKPGEIGVYASHISLHKALLDRDDIDALLVMEDDLELAPDFAAVITALEAMPVDWDIIKLSNPPKAPYLDHGEIAPGRALVTYSRVPNNLGAYVISRSGAAKTTRLRGLRVWAIDEDMRRPWDWEIETLGIVPPPARANIFETSSIDAMGERALGKESTLQKLARRRWGGPVDWLRQIRWQIRHLGAWGYLGTILRTILKSLIKRMTPASAGAGLRIPGARRR